MVVHPWPFAIHQKVYLRDFPDGPVVKTASTAGSAGSIPGLGTKISYALLCGQKKKKSLSEIFLPSGRIILVFLCQPVLMTPLFSKAPDFP